jgi:hypothetical protein
MIEEEFVDDGGPLYYEADHREEVPEAEFKDDGGPLYYEDDGGLIDRPPAIPEDEPPEDFPPAPQE